VPTNGEVSISRNARVSAVAAGTTGLVAAAYFVRAVGGGGVVDWLVLVGLVALTAVHLASLRDARTPLLVADEHGVRIRVGRAWRGMPWSALEEVEHLPRRGVLRDGRLVLFPRDLDAELAALDRRGRRLAGLTARLHGAPLAVPLGLTTSLAGAEGDLTGALVGLAGNRCDIVEIVPGIEDEAEVLEDDTAETPAVASPTPSPMREAVTAVRAELPYAPEATVAMETTEVADTGVWRASTVLIDDLADVPGVEPVIGPQLRAARERLRLSVDQLAERTRIRPHVIEALEIDDFVPCGGDFYARGHLRTLARVLGLDAAPLLDTYADRYADAPVDPRRVFEAELATGRGGPLKGTRGGPNWSVLVAAVMAVVLVWSVARLVMDQPPSVTPATPSLANGSAGLTGGGELAPTVDVLLTAAGGGAHVVVRDGSGRVLFKDSIAFGATQALKVSPPVRVQSSDGSLEVTVDGQEHGALGETGQTAQDVFTAR
jgi:cytoskeleton protein RodZ